MDGVQELKRFILQRGAAVEVMEPGWLREEIGREHATAAERAGEKIVTLDDMNVVKDRRAR